MRAVLTQIRAAVFRRRAQTATVLIVSLLAGTIATMALTLLVRSTQPWDEAFERYSGPHLLFHFDASRVSPDQLRASASLPGVTAAGPPYQTVEVAFSHGEEKSRLQLIGRDDPGGAVDRLPIYAGRWPQAAGEIAVTRTEDISFPFRPRLGDTIHALTNHGTVDFKVVAEVINLAGHGSILDFSNGVLGSWVLPSEIAQFTDGAHPLGYEMSYRFQHAATAEELAADRRGIEGVLPAEAETQPVVDWQLNALARSG
jgi:putative ABC transport system permease protein